MRIVCPACSAAYEVPDALLGTGRPVRCARCGREWTPADAAQQRESPQAEATQVEGSGEPSRAGSVVERVGELPASGTGLSISVVEPPPQAAPETGPPATPEPAADPGEPEPVMEPALTASAEQALVEPRAPREGTLLRLAWAASVLAILLLAWAAYGWRTEIMQAWPASERIYAALGLAGGSR